MTKKTELETKTAHATGVGPMGNKIEPGKTFNAPTDFKGSWFRGPSDGQKANVRSEELVNAAHVGLLSKAAKDIVPALAAMTSRELNELIIAETAGERRKGVINKAQDILDSRIGEIGGPDPAAKNPEETEPITPAGTEATGDNVFE